MTGKNDINDQLLQLLTEIRDNQRVQLEQQLEGLKLQRQHFVNAEQTIVRAESLIDKNKALIQDGRKGLLYVVLPLLILAALIFFLPFVFR